MQPCGSSRACHMFGWLRGDVRFVALQGFVLGARGPRVSLVTHGHARLCGGSGSRPWWVGGGYSSFLIFSPSDPCAGVLRFDRWALPFRPMAFRTVSSVPGLPSCFSPAFFMAWPPPPWLLLCRSAPCRFGRLCHPLASRPFPTVTSSARPVPPAGPGGLALPRVPSPAFLLVGSGGHCLGRVVLRLRGL